jgi:hypothetical protein
MAIKKISYFWMNFNSLKFLGSYIVKFARDIYGLYNDIYKIKGITHHYNVLKLLFHENSII